MPPKREPANNTEENDQYECETSVHREDDELVLTTSCRRPTRAGEEPEKGDEQEE